MMKTTMIAVATTLALACGSDDGDGASDAVLVAPSA
jgi:hypothetical protein